MEVATRLAVPQATLFVVTVKSLVTVKPQRMPHLTTGQLARPHKQISTCICAQNKLPQTATRSSPATHGAKHNTVQALLHHDRANTTLHPLQPLTWPSSMHEAS